MNIKPHMYVQKYRGAWWTIISHESEKMKSIFPDRHNRFSTKEKALQSAERYLNNEAIDNLHVFDDKGNHVKTQAICIIRPDDINEHQ
jgi:hypothetical protein|tara:strand:+ start:418 stop:681 length:264 start_codon:yes stop_codon:yes gene_type:complete